MMVMMIEYLRVCLARAVSTTNMVMSPPTRNVNITPTRAPGSNREKKLSHCFAVEQFSAKRQMISVTMLGVATWEAVAGHAELGFESATRFTFS
jgi:hypothetical protein